MKINHLNLCLSDVPAARTFFETYFNFTCRDTKENSKFAALDGEDGFVLVLMQDDTPSYPDNFHVGFFVEKEEDVIAVYERLTSGGIVVTQAPGRIRRTFGFYFRYQQILMEVAVEN
jgi:predicted enzyme related to lactoylglutathione lyase